MSVQSTMKPKHCTLAISTVALLIIGMTSGCTSQGPSQTQVESINAEIKAQKPNNLPPAPPPTDVMPAAPGGGMAGPKKGGH